ncbi:hypothetical protein ABIC28_003752 [Rhodococcus sp. PvR044]|jgi:hypothetical protein|uniref:DUF4267 domain-containing protein n=1 Tax=Rhodococcus TaxID=1827 RepID=UPI000BCA5AAB|nr:MULTISPECIES: DUF4267 domain-containing protein [Rhodococcus]MBP1160622.1 hypothetical protein [Rhodococcus sp. PvR099]MCZ4556368.1 DUF4267 domain-containing protein [Rhodococcus maanshanensis]PTR43068.1 uncharacterized protein DUF4267 [Rhodococcus sp. OK611]SNX91403.1 protein of unknown function [Rhodococcus sp. OK270]
MLNWIGLVISWIGALGIIAIGVAYMGKNAKNAAGFGLPTSPAPDARGWWQVKGIRDIASGLLVIVFTFAARDQLALLMLLLAFVPLGDMWIVLTNGGPRKAAFGIHGATAVAMIAAAGLLVA